MISLGKMINGTMKMCNRFSKHKQSCPLLLTAKCNNHFGVFNKNKKKEIAGFDMHGNFTIKASDVLLLSFAITLFLSLTGIVDKIAFKCKFKKR